MAAPQLITLAQEFIKMPAYADRIPEAVRNDITKLGYYIASETFDPTVLTPWLQGMLTKIGKQLVEGYEHGGTSFNTFDKGEIPIGGYIENDFIGAVAGEKYPLEMTNGESIDPFVVNKPKVTVTYFALNFGMQYWTSIRDVSLSEAVISNEAMANFIQACIGVLAESYKLDKYLTIREMFGAGDIYGKTVDYAINGTETSLTQEEAIGIVNTITTTAKAMTWDNTQYNKAAVLNSVKKDDLVLVISAPVHEMIKSALRTVFHADIDFKVNEVVEVDGFGTVGAQAGMYAALVSRKAVKLYNKQNMRTNNIFNVRGEYWNHFLKGLGWIGYANVAPAVKLTLSAKG